MPRPFVIMRVPIVLDYRPLQQGLRHKRRTPFGDL